jgi:Raf kinase inhibitor-like YbhB/YbcL family protein
LILELKEVGGFRMRFYIFILSLILIGGQAMALTLTSPVFKPATSIPAHYTCDGDNVSPPLEWSGVPVSAKSLVLIMDDPDVPKTLRADGMYDHWVLFNIPTSVMGLSENSQDIPGAVKGNNTSGKPGYTGPCPPDREHRYFFKLYALDTILNLSEGSSKAQVEAAMKGHILEQTQLQGVYNRPQNIKKS